MASIPRLSSNGTPIAGAVADEVAAIGFDYVGISLDGIGATNDWFRGQDGAFDAALSGVRACMARGIKVGLRYTMTNDNAQQLPDLLDLADAEGVDKFYLSHLVYAGRGNKHRCDDTGRPATRAGLDLLLDRAWQAVERSGHDFEIVTGNNDADAVYFLQWARERFAPERGGSCTGAPRSMGRKFVGPAASPTSIRRASCIPIPIGRAMPSTVSRTSLQHDLARSERADAGGAAHAPAAAQGPMRRLRSQIGLRRQYADSARCNSPAIPGKPIRPAICPTPRSA